MGQGDQGRQYKRGVDPGGCFGSVSAIRRDERHVRTSADRCKMLHYRRRPSGPATDESAGAANTFRRSCTDGVWAVANAAAWLSLLMDRLRRHATGRRRTRLALQRIRKPLLMSTGQIWQGPVHSRPRGRDFVVVSFFEGETDGFDFEG